MYRFVVLHQKGCNRSKTCSSRYLLLLVIGVSEAKILQKLSRASHNIEFCGGGASAVRF